MSKSDQSAARTQTQQQVTQNNANSSAANTQLQGILGTATNTAGSILPGVTSGYSDISATGGYDPNILGTINSTYGNLATTGGISSQDQTNLENQASATARSTYSTGADAAKRQIAATGGYGAGSGATLSALARGGSNAASSAITNADASIVGLRQQGQIAGASGLNQTQQSQVGNKLTALGGNANIYGMNESQVSTTVGQILQNFQQTGQLNNQDLSILTNLANQPGVFDKIVGTIGSLGGAAAGVIKAVSPTGLIP